MENDLRFLSQKLEELGTGLFINQSDAVLKINAAIVNLIKVDDAAQLWFFVPKPTQQIEEFEKIFHGQMHFYKKGKNFFFKIRGKAFIVTDPAEIAGLAEIDESVKQAALAEKVLIKVKIKEIDYYESKRKEKSSFIYKIPMHLQNLLSHPRRGYRPFRFGEVAY